MEMHKSSPCLASGEPLQYCDHGKAIEEIRHGHELMTQLRALLLPLLPAGRCSELVGCLFEDILRCSTAALAGLRDGSCRPAAASDTEQGSKGTDEKRKNPEVIRQKPHGHKRRKKINSWSLVTSVPHHDGHQWRKYGQKQISDAKHPRSYYRCTHSKDQGCPATKTVQQEDQDADPPKFTVTYNMAHSCKTIDSTIPFVIESAPERDPDPKFEANSLCFQEPYPPPPPPFAAKNYNQDKSREDGNQEPRHMLLSEYPETMMLIRTPEAADVISDMLSPMQTDWWMMMMDTNFGKATHF